MEVVKPPEKDLPAWADDVWDSDEGDGSSYHLSVREMRSMVPDPYGEQGTWELIYITPNNGTFHRRVDPESELELENFLKIIGYFAP